MRKPLRRPSLPAAVRVRTIPLVDAPTRLPVGLPVGLPIGLPVGLLAALLFGLVGLVGLAGLLVAAPAEAHTELLRSTPKAGSTVRAPSVVVLQFSEPVLDVGLQVQVSGPGGRVDDGPARRAGAGVLQALDPGLAAGAYRVIWRVTSDDGHPVQGTFGFTATDPGGSTAVGTASPGSAGPTTAPGTARATTRPTPVASGAESSAGPLPSTLAAAPASSGAGSSSTRWTIAGVAIVLLALVAALIASRRPRNRDRGDHARPTG